MQAAALQDDHIPTSVRGCECNEQTKGERLKAAKCREVFPLSLFTIVHRQLPRKRWSLLVRFTSSQISLPPRGRWILRSKRRRELACPERGGGCECSEQTEGLHRGCSYLRQPLSQSALRRIASSPSGEPFGCDTICQDIRVNAQVGTRSPYSPPFVILPVPARSPFRLLVHRTRSTPNPIDKPPFSGL